MFAKLTSGLDFHAKALVLRAERQRILASNMANADTPGYASRDFNFKEALSQQTQTSDSELSKAGKGLSLKSSTGITDSRHLQLPAVVNSELSGNNAMLRCGPRVVRGVRRTVQPLKSPSPPRGEHARMPFLASWA